MRNRKGVQFGRSWLTVSRSSNCECGIPLLFEYVLNDGCGSRRVGAGTLQHVRSR
jgi:hypothetical protein